MEFCCIRSAGVRFQFENAVLDFRLTSSAGTMLCIGRSNYLRFNHPAEARLMKSILPNARISMAPLTLYSGTVSCRTPRYPWHRSPSIQVQYPAERPDIHGTAHPLFRYSTAAHCYGRQAISYLPTARTDYCIALLVYVAIVVPVHN